MYSVPLGLDFEILGACPVKKGRHRRFEEARALKRSDNVDLDGIFESLDDNGTSGVSDWEDVADEYSQWADVAAEFEAKQTDEPPGSDDAQASAASASDESSDASESPEEEASEGAPEQGEPAEASEVESA